MVTTDEQVRKLMKELKKQASLEVAAGRSGMSPNTARKYVELGRLPSELKQPRSWRTREDPFADDWEEVKERLAAAPELEAKALFEHLLASKPEQYHAGQLRTFQRHVKRWRATEGPPKEVFFAQEHRPGEAAQTDFTCCNVLGITIEGEAFPHLLCHVVLPYSNWEWATVCRSESLAALKVGVQSALFELGSHPEFHQTDNSTAATHQLVAGGRGFNEDYLGLMRHLGMKPRTIAIGKSNQNGDVESLHGALKRRLRQHLLLRDSWDFATVDGYQAWMEDVLRAANRLRSKRLQEELAAMNPLPATRLPEFTEVKVKVTSWSTIRVKHNTYSVPSKLQGEEVCARVYENRLEVYFAGERRVVVERLLGRNGHRINYRHIIWSLMRKPGAFERYRYREELFPSLVFRQAYDTLSEQLGNRKGDVEYLRVLHLAASTMESEVEAALTLVLEANELPTSDAVKALVAPLKPSVPMLRKEKVDLQEYDGLLVGDASSTEEVAS